MEEHNRLLYVALTRAEDRLLVCGWQTRRGLERRVLVPAGRTRLRQLAGRAGAVRRLGRRTTALRHAAACGTGPRAGPGDAAAGRSLCRPGPARRRAGAPVPCPPNLAGRSGWHPAGPRTSNSDRCRPPPRRSRPGRRRATGTAAAPCCTRCYSICRTCRAIGVRPRRRAWLDRPGNGLPAGETETLTREVLAILDHPELAPLFGPGSRAEVPLTGLVGGTVVGGLVDRLAVLDDRVLIADYKTNRRRSDERRGHAAAVPAADGGLPCGSARHLPGPHRGLRAGLDPDIAGCHAA